MQENTAFILKTTTQLAKIRNSICTLERGKKDIEGNYGLYDNRQL